MPTIIPQPETNSLARDASGKIVERVSIQDWRPQRQTILETDWVLLGDGANRSSIYIKNNGADDVILAPNDTDYSNDPTQATAGLTVPAGGTIEPSFTARLPIYARVTSGGAACQLEVVEAF